MRILQLIDSLNAGGAERMAVSIANNLAATEHKSFLSVTRKEGLLKASLAEGVIFFNAQKSHFLDAFAFFRLLKFIQSEKINIIHAHGTSLYWGVLLKIFIPKICLIWHAHSGKLTNLKGVKFYIRKVFSKQASAILVVNKALLFWATTKLDHDRVFYLQNWPEISIGDTRVTKKDKIIVCVANLRPIKGQDILLRSFKKVQADFNDWILLLVGKDYNDAYSAQLKQYVNGQGLKEFVVFLGEQDNVHGFLEKASIGVLASVSEGLPVALLEYGMHRLPVVVTNVGECAHVVSNRKHGFVVEQGNEEAIAQALTSLVSNKNLREEYGEAFYQHITQEYSEHKGIQKLLGVYEQVTK